MQVLGDEVFKTKSEENASQEIEQLLQVAGEKERVWHGANKV